MDSYYLAILYILIGLPLLTLGGERIVRYATRIANQYRISTAIISVTVIAIGTSSPEAIVSILAAAKGNPDIAMANVISSNIINIAMVLGITILAVPLYSEKRLLSNECPALIVSSLLLYFFILDRELSRWEAIVLTISCIAFTYFMVLAAKKNRQEASIQDATKKGIEDLGLPLRNILGLIFSFLVLFLGGKLTLEGAVTVAEKIGLSERVIGLTVVAIGTSLPELATSIAAMLKKKHEIALGTIIGSNIYNILGVLGLSGLMNSLRVDDSIVRVDSIPFLATAFILVAAIFLFKKIPRPLGAFFILAWCLYIYMLFTK